MEKVLPAGGFSPDWAMKDKVAFRNPDTLFEHINGEAELYMPYGFELLATATYVTGKNNDAWLVADVYRMGSLLDAFGIYSNYRKADAEAVRIGADGFISQTQMMFYQDRYFVRLQVTGIGSLERGVFLDLGSIISKNLPSNPNRPAEIDAMGVAAVVPRSERYIARGLLGYAFFRRGMTANVSLKGERPRVFVVMEDTPVAARGALEQYRAYLKNEGQDVKWNDAGGRLSLESGEPLYDRVFALQADRRVIGVIGAGETPAARKLVEDLQTRFTGGTLKP